MNMFHLNSSWTKLWDLFLKSRSKGSFKWLHLFSYEICEMASEDVFRIKTFVGRGTIGRKWGPTTPMRIEVPVHVSTNAPAVTMWGAALSPQSILWKETDVGKSWGKWLVKCGFQIIPLQVMCLWRDKIPMDIMKPWADCQRVWRTKGSVGYDKKWSRLV